MKILLLRLFPQFEAFLEFPRDSTPRYGWGRPAHRLLYEACEEKRSTFASYLESFVQYQDDFVRIPKTSNDDITPMWNNDMFPALDAIALYGMLCVKRPKLYLEIGSGYSTRFLPRAKDDFMFHHGEEFLAPIDGAVTYHFYWSGGQAPAARIQLDAPVQVGSIICIDPSPRTSVGSVADRFISSPLQDLDMHFFGDLGPNDILFIDGSHRVFMNSDVAVLFLEILPNLTPGVIVQMHDIHLPYDYPPEWGKRYYNEQYLLATYLLAGHRLDILLANAFVTRDEPLRNILQPIWTAPEIAGATAYGASFWAMVK